MSCAELFPLIAPWAAPPRAVGRPTPGPQRPAAAASLAAPPIARRRPRPSVPSIPALPANKPRASRHGLVRRRLRMLFGAAALTVVLASVAYVGYWAAMGGRWYIVKTPSMGQAAPVGTLLWVMPATAVHVGDMITFRPPGPGTTYSHRIHAIAADGAITTKGDANGSPDPWRLTRSEIVGKVSMRWWACGWLVRAAPILIIGSLVLWFVTGRFARQRWRLPLRVVGVALLVSLSTYLLRPLVGAQQIALLPTDPGVRATYVSTGLLPLLLRADGGAHARLVSGQTATVSSSAVGKDGHYLVRLSPDITWWWWLVLIALCFLPAVWTTLFGRRPCVGDGSP